MYIESDYETITGIKLTAAILRIPAITVSHINPSGEFDSAKFYLGFQVDAYIDAAATAPCDSRYYTVEYDSTVEVVEQAHSAILAMDAYKDGKLVTE